MTAPPILSRYTAAISTHPRGEPSASPPVHRRRGIANDVPDGPRGRLTEAIIDWKNAQFLEDLSRNVKRGLHDPAHQGYAPGGFPPRDYLAKKIQIGVKNDDPRYASLWIPDPEMVPRVQKSLGDACIWRHLQ